MDTVQSGDRPVNMDEPNDESMGTSEWDNEPLPMDADE
jgi:hypothetical protein